MTVTADKLPAEAPEWCWLGNPYAQESNESLLEKRTNE
jgi:hypothetical protein